jgi:hypothetical protein
MGDSAEVEGAAGAAAGPAAETAGAEAGAAEGLTEAETAAEPAEEDTAGACRRTFECGKAKDIARLAEEEGS